MIRFLDTEIYEVNNIPEAVMKELQHRPYAQRRKGNPCSRTPKYYKDMVTAFDIETTRLHDYTKQQLDDDKTLTDDTVMYIWQWCFTYNISTIDETPVFKEVCIYGRTWSDFLDFTGRLTDNMGEHDFIMVFDHNLAYEFQFLRGVLPFAEDNVFSVKSRVPLYASSNHLEFRCSYKQSNMSLRKFAEQMDTPHQKTELDYDKKRYYYTPLTHDEIEYAVNDVICLTEAMIIRMIRDNDNLYSVPLTSTGYVRREVREAVKSDKVTYKKIKSIQPDFDVYLELKEAFRGGNTHANRYYSDEIIKGTIHSADRSSSYPAVICNREYPMSKFERVADTSTKNISYLMNTLHRCILTRVKITGLHLQDEHWGCPYIALAKSREIQNELLDNGRVISASEIVLTVTDVDISIILDEYDFDTITFFDTYSAKYGKIPQPIVDKVIEYYVKKTTLKGVAGEEYFYVKNKNLLNSIYGMMVQDMVKILVLYEEGDEDGVQGYFQEDLNAVPIDIFEKAQKKAFLNYAWGVWVTAWARYELERGIKLAGSGFIYCDTDSVKYVGDVDWSDYNAEKIAESIQSGSHATDPKGNEHYMGVFEAEHDMSEFKTMGAKKYAYIDTDGKLSITIAGVGKSTGRDELIDKADGEDPLELFAEGFEFTSKAGGLEAVYNDMPYGEQREEINEEGRPVTVISNVTLRPSTYTISLTPDYRELTRLCTYTDITDIGDDFI